ncbi:MAG: aminotransferase class I/II-fold pyridoxal phosphate-dependent enzyme [Acidimicrobiales bacterium]
MSDIHHASPTPDRIHLSAPHMTDRERDALLSAFDSNWIAPAGAALDDFEQGIAERAGTEAALATTSGTAALHLALRVLGIVRGDTVLVPTLTFVASANAVRYMGAVPYFIDAEEHTANIDPNLVESTIEQLHRAGRTPAAVMTVDLYGSCADHGAIREICDRYDIPIVEDAAEAIGATHRGRPAGALGDLGVFSFNGNKLVTTGGGGALVGPTAWIDRARHLATQARDHALHYEHSEVGYAYRMSNVLAAIGNAQLARLDDMVDATRWIRARYVEALGDVDGLQFQSIDVGGRSNAWLTVALFDERRHPAPHEICHQLALYGIEARPAWKPMHLQPLFSGNEIAGGSVSERHYRRGLCLPSGSSMTSSEQDRVIEALRAVIGADDAATPVDLAAARDQRFEDPAGPKEGQNDAISATSGQSGDQAAQA